MDSTVLLAFCGATVSAQLRHPGKTKKTKETKEAKALSRGMSCGLHAALKTIDQQSGLRNVRMAGQGGHFCAGRAIAGYQACALMNAATLLQRGFLNLGPSALGKCRAAQDCTHLPARCAGYTHE